MKHCNVGLDGNAGRQNDLVALLVPQLAQYAGQRIGGDLFAVSDDQRKIDLHYYSLYKPLMVHRGGCSGRNGKVAPDSVGVNKGFSAAARAD